MPFSTLAPPASRHWFDLASPWRRRVVLPANPPGWIHRFSLDFAPERVDDPASLVVADRARRPFQARVAARHADGSVARLDFALPVGRVTEREFAPWVDVYYGSGPQRQEPAIEWNAGRRSVRGPYFDASFDETGGLSRLVYRQVDCDLLETASGPGMAPVVRIGKKPSIVNAVPTRFLVESEDDSQTDCRLAVVVEQETAEMSLRRRFGFTPSHITVEFEFSIYKPLAFLSPLAVRHRPESGCVIAPDGERSFVKREGSRGLTAATSPGLPGFAFSSETGYFLWAEPTDSSLPDRFEFHGPDGIHGLAALGYSNLKAGETVSGRFRFVPAPFAGDFTLERARELRALFLSPNEVEPRVQPEETSPLTVRPIAVTDRGTERCGLEVGLLRFVVESPARDVPAVGSASAPPVAPPGPAGRVALETVLGKAILWTDTLYRLESERGISTGSGPSEVSVDAGAFRMGAEMTGPLGARWRIRSRVVARLLEGEVLFEEERRSVLLGPHAAEARFRLDVATPCGPPAWDSGEATVFIPGQMGRGNYRPGQWHGGGPKWGPSEDPKACEFCKHKNEPSHANHWTLAASRIPNAWVVAADRAQGVLAFLGSEPRADLGETSVGFRSPADGTTTLSLATPITYEPWLPHGYGGFDPHPRRDTRTVTPGEEIVWRIFYSGKATKNLNDWFDLDKALYGLIARYRPDPYRMTRETALRIALGSLYRNFYNPEFHTISYGTGPDARHAPIGFTGMSHCALALLMGGSRLGVDEWREAGAAVMEEIAGAFLEGPGFPFAGWSPEGGWTACTTEPGYAILCALDSLLEAIEHERERGLERPRWIAAARRCCEAWLAAQSAEGAYPLKHPAMGAKEFPVADYAATNVTVGVIACLVDAARLLGDDRYLESARRAAEFYGGLLDEGKLWGGPGDIEALVNSEVPMFYLRSFVRLARRTGDPRHRAWARDAAAWRLGFQFAHCWTLDFGSPLYRQGWAGLGSEDASASNLHSVSFGSINTPDYILARELFQDDHWSLRLRDLTDYATQQFGRFDGDLDILEEGQGTESWWTSDTKWGKGAILILADKPNLGFMAWTTGWSAYGLLHALKNKDQTRMRKDEWVGKAAR